MSEYVKEVGAADFEAEVLKVEDMPVVVDFWAPWCGPCRAMAPVFEAVATKYASKAKFCKVNTDENKDFLDQYGIKGIPTFLVFKGGVAVNTIIGRRPQEEFEKFVEPFL